jgi:hypothetical protein
MLSIIGAIFLIIQLIKVINNYLNLEYIIVMKVIDKYFVEKPVTDIAHGMIKLITSLNYIKNDSQNIN